MVGTMLVPKSTLAWNKAEEGQHQTTLSLVASPTRTGEGSLWVNLNEKCSKELEMTIKTTDIRLDKQIGGSDFDF